MRSTSEWRSLSHAPKSVVIDHEIGIVYNQSLVEFYNKLTPQERVMIYYLYKASLPGNRIAADQTHRYSLELQEIFEHILASKEHLTDKNLGLSAVAFIDQVKSYLIYLWTNHGPYFIREHADSKRTPERIGLSLLTPATITKALTVTGYKKANQMTNDFEKFLFDHLYEPTVTVPNSIDQSAVNFYAPDFTDADFAQIDTHGQSAINAYFYIDTNNGNRVPTYQLLSAQGRYGKELTESIGWLTKALAHACDYSAQFDEHFVKSLEYLIDYLKSGNEELFKKHSIEWLKTNNKIDYTFGFIETYDDPKSYRALFQADVTIKSVDIESLNKLLPSLEDRLPFDAAFKRSTLHANQGAMPNASINVKAFSSGGLGPLITTIAYCLPNYNEIRSDHGSKQIMYHTDKAIGELLNPAVYHRLFNSNEQYAWFQEHNPEYDLMQDIHMLEVILHETLGHGSGKLANHTTATGEIIPLTSNNLATFLVGYDSSLEELRAEIIALLSSIICFDDFARAGMLKDWPKKVSKEKLIELTIISMARTGLRRLIQQPDSAQEISGAHAQANMVILNYLIDHGAIVITSESCTIEDKEYTVIDTKVLSIDRSIEVITQLACLVQKIKSTGDGVAAQSLFQTYGTKIDHPEYMRQLKANMKATVGDTKVLALIYPEYTPLKNAQGTIIDIDAVWPADIVEQWMGYKESMR